MVLSGGFAVPFTAFWIRGKKHMKLLTSFYTNSQIATTEETTEGEGEEGGERRTVNCVVPVARTAYLHSAGSVDRANAGILAYRYPHRVLNWDVALLLWCIKLIVHNAHVLYQAVNRCHMPLHQFVKLLVNELAPPKDEDIEDEMDKHITDTRADGKTGKCVICQMKDPTKRNTSTHWCLGCKKPMHKKCARDANGNLTSEHFKYCLRRTRIQKHISTMFS